MVENCKQFKDIREIMKRVDGSFLYNFGVALGPIMDVQPDQDHNATLAVAHRARYWLDIFLNKSIFKPKTSYAKGNELLTLLNQFVGKTKEETQADLGKVGHYYAYNIKEGLRQFETVLTAEFGLEDLYLVFQKRGYDNKALIDNATVLFPAELTQKIPEAEFDIKQAGRVYRFRACYGSRISLTPCK